MNQVLLALQAGAQVLVAAVLLGAGLPVIFSLGMRSLAFGTGGAAEVDTTMKPHPVGRVLAGVCFGVVVLAILLGIAWIVGAGMGYALSFDHIFPVFRKK